MSRFPGRSGALLVLVAAVVAVVFVLQVGGGDTSQEAGPTAARPTSTPAVSTPQEFCAAFRAFADAHGSLVSSGSGAGEQLVAAARSLVELGRPMGLSEGGWVSLLELVNGSVAAVPSATPFAVPSPGTPDPSGMDAYLLEACPP